MESENISLQFAINETSKNLTDLLPYKNYTFTLLVQNEEGNSTGKEAFEQTAEWSKLIEILIFNPSP